MEKDLTLVIMILVFQWGIIFYYVGKIKHLYKCIDNLYSYIDKLCNFEKKNTDHFKVIYDYLSKFIDMKGEEDAE